jgi:hypothetical protein
MKFKLIYGRGDEQAPTLKNIAEILKFSRPNSKALLKFWI